MYFSKTHRCWPNSRWVVMVVVAMVFRLDQGHFSCETGDRASKLTSKRAGNRADEWALFRSISIYIRIYIDIYICIYTVFFLLGLPLRIIYQNKPVRGRSNQAVDGRSSGQSRQRIYFNVYDLSFLQSNRFISSRICTTQLHKTREWDKRKERKIFI